MRIAEVDYLVLYDIENQDNLPIIAKQLYSRKNKQGLSEDKFKIVKAIKSVFLSIIIHIAKALKYHISLSCYTIITTILLDFYSI